MGRSQVLYNRTKGRYRNRNGAPGRGVSTERATPYDEPTNLQLPGPQPTLASAKSRRAKIDESILLAEPMTTYAGQSLVVDEDSMFAQGGIIDIASMAATLTSSMSLAQRLRIPCHVAYQLQNPNAMLDSRKAKPRKETKIVEDPQPIDDDASFSVAHTRLRVGSDGQVEARPKPGLYNPFSVAESFEDENYAEHVIEKQKTAIRQSEPKAIHTKPPAGLQAEESVQNESHNRLSTFDESLDSDARCIRHGKDFDDDDEEEDDRKDRYLAIIDTNDEDEHHPQPLSAQPLPATTVISSSFETGYSSLPPQPQMSAATPLSPVQRTRVPLPAGKEKPGTRPPKVNTSLEKYKQTSTATTPKHANSHQVSVLPVTREEESESYLEGWLDEAMKSSETPIPVRHIPVDPIDENQDDFSSITGLPYHGGSSVSTLTVSKVGARTSDNSTYKARNRPYMSMTAKEPQFRLHEEEEDRRFRTLGSICSSGSSVGGSTMDSRGQIYDDDGSVQPLKRKPEPPPHSKKKASSSKKKNEEVGDDLDAWLDSVIS